MTNKPCSEIAKEILTKVPRGTFTKSRKDFIAERIIQALQTERTAREKLEAQLQAQAEVIGRMREALKKSKEIGHELCDTAQRHEDCQEVLDWIEHEHMIKDALTRLEAEGKDGS